MCYVLNKIYQKMFSWGQLFVASLGINTADALHRVSEINMIVSKCNKSSTAT